MRERKRKSDDGRAATRRRRWNSCCCCHSASASAGTRDGRIDMASLLFRLLVVACLLDSMALLPFLLLLQRRPRHAGPGNLPAEPARATIRAAVHPRASIGQHAPAAAAATTTATATAATVDVTIIVAVALTVCGGGIRGVCAGTGAGAAERGGEVFGRDEVEERRVLIGLIGAEDQDLVERARREPWLDHAPDGGEGRRCVDDDELAHTM